MSNKYNKKMSDLSLNFVSLSFTTQTKMNTWAKNKHTVQPLYYYNKETTNYHFNCTITTYLT